MTFSQYGDYLYLYILILSLIPAVVLGLMGKRIKYYGVFISVIMIALILGVKSRQMLLFAMFIIGEISIILIYSFLRKKTSNKYIYYVFLFASVLPLLITKGSIYSRFGVIGFIGLSYLNFKAIQIIIEIYDGIIKEINFQTLIYFLLFFPTLSSGPVDRLRRFQDDLHKKISGREYLNEYLLEGIKKIIMGIGYKFVLAYIIDTYFLLKISQDITVINSVKYMYAYSLYLFFDFAGYSLFAVGTSYILGIRTPDNFNKPFISKDMKEFWTRWHMSLSRWFGDYLYSRLLLNFMRKKTFKSRFTASHVSQIVTMAVMGLWHGFQGFYLIYGLYQGSVLVLTDIYQRKSKFYKKHKKEKWFQMAQIIVNFHVACFGLLLFSGFLIKK
ncbi:MAG: D-alanyl-lipoteichoic acid biosynthesis protein DltB [Clostridiaceae bacterium]